MRKIKRNKTVKLIVLLVSLAVLLIAGWLAYAYKTQSWPFDKSQTAQEQQKITEANTTDSLNTQKKDGMIAGSKSEYVDTQKTSDQIPVSDDLSVKILSVGQSENGIVSYSASANKPAGTCSATFTHELGKPVIRNSDTTDGKCSAEISAMEFDALGEWTLTLRYYSNNAQAVATQTVKVN